MCLRDINAVFTALREISQHTDKVYGGQVTKNCRHRHQPRPGRRPGDDRSVPHPLGRALADLTQIIRPAV